MTFVNILLVNASCQKTVPFCRYWAVRVDMFYKIAAFIGIVDYGIPNLLLIMRFHFS